LVITRRPVSDVAGRSLHRHLLTSPSNNTTIGKFSQWCDVPSAGFAILAVVFGFAGCAPAIAQGVPAAAPQDALPTAHGLAASADSPPSTTIVWNTDGFLGPCHGDCSIAIYGGREVRTEMSRLLLLRQPAPIWETQWGDSELVAGTFSRRLATVWGRLNIEPEFGVAKRFGIMTAGEFWAGLTFRWTAFPWNDLIKTTVAVTEGVSLATQVEPEERRESVPGHTGSVFLNFFSPEITFAPPGVSAYELVFRLHHRSGIFGLVNNVEGGAQYETVGIRVHF